jgi:hypothetical protein
MTHSKEQIEDHAIRAQSRPELCETRTPSDHDFGVLLALADAARRFSMRRGREFVRPMDIGGNARRNVSAALARLEKLALVVSRPRDLAYSVPHPSRIHREYKITDAGFAAAQDFDSRINSSLTCRHTEKEAEK